MSGNAPMFSQEQGDSDSSQEVRRFDEKGDNTEGVSLPMSVIKALRRKGRNGGSEGGSNSSGGASVNNSENSALVSIGNTSFGFNFDSEEAMNGSGNGESDSDGNGGSQSAKKQVKKEGNAAAAAVPAQQQPKLDQPQKKLSPMSPPPSSSAFVASSTQAKMIQFVKTGKMPRAFFGYDLQSSFEYSLNRLVEESQENKRRPQTSTKRKASDRFENDSGGYNSDDEGAESKQSSGGSASVSQPAQNLSSANQEKPPAADEAAAPDPGDAETVDGEDDCGSPKSKKKKRMDDGKRVERNAREKERSFRISKQINELRNLLSSGGVIVPKGTKSSVLTEAANYIRMLQQHQYRSEIDRHQLVQQMQMIGGGALGPQAAQVIRHVAAQNGVWSLGNFGGVPPKSAMARSQGGEEQGLAPQAGGPFAQASQQPEPMLQTSLDDHEYRFVFNSCSVGMAIASMGGAFIDCNLLFCQLSNFTKQEVCSMTIFNLTARDDLQPAFDLISQMISPPLDSASQPPPKSCVLRGAMNHRNDLGLNVSLVKGPDGIAKCFCVTLIKKPASPYDTSKPIPATAAMLHVSSGAQAKDDGSGALEANPAFTSG